MTNSIQISVSEYQKLQRESSKLAALEAGGVDNWEWYGESLKDWHKENDIDELIEGFTENVNDLLTEAEVDEPAGFGCGYSITFDEDFLAKLLRKFIKDYETIKEGY